MTKSTMTTENLALEAAGTEMAPLLKRVRTYLEERRDRLVVFSGPEKPAQLHEKFGFSSREKGLREVILAGDVAVELGHPTTASQAIILLTHQPDLICHERISLLGPDFPGMLASRRYAFAQIVMLSLKPGSMPDPFQLGNTQYLMHRLPGYMVRSVPGRLWARVSKKGLADKLSLKVVGSALIAAYLENFSEVAGVEVVFVTESPAEVTALDQLALEADILAGHHRKLVLGLNGELECFDLNCQTCNEKPICDSLRDIVVKKRKETC
jgi:hypothetical protein